MPLPAHRGTPLNPVNRFERLAVEPDPDWYDEDEKPPATLYLRDDSQSILTYNNSPDLGFDASLNP